MKQDLDGFLDENQADATETEGWIVAFLREVC